MIQREIIYRILQGAEGARLRAITTLGEQSHRTAKAIAWFKSNDEKPLRVEELAQMARMGVSTFHHHFREMTAMSPVQYQKQLRLQAARARMLTDDLDASSAAMTVGYESVSQFNREYSRFFGQPPMRDIRALRLSWARFARFGQKLEKFTAIESCLCPPLRREQMPFGTEMRSAWILAEN